MSINIAHGKKRRMEIFAENKRKKKSSSSLATLLATVKEYFIYKKSWSHWLSWVEKCWIVCWKKCAKNEVNCLPAWDCLSWVLGLGSEIQNGKTYKKKTKLPEKKEGYATWRELANYKRELEWVFLKYSAYNKLERCF